MSELGGIALAAGLLGLVASLIGYRDYKRMLEGGGLLCRATAKGVIDCASVYSIPQALFAGRYHFSELAPPYFAVLTVAAAIYAVTGSLYPMLALSLLGLLFVPYLFYLEVKVARALCAWCTIMHISIIAVAAASILSLLG